jgi:hypothetical protein
MNMEMVKMDKRGRISLKKFITFTPDYFMINETYEGHLLLTPIYGISSVEEGLDLFDDINRQT